MALLDQVRVYPRRLHADARGWLLKLMTGAEEGLSEAREAHEAGDGFGEAYAVLAQPGEARGHHYHPRAVEWFTVVMGEGFLDLEDPHTHEQRRIRLTGPELRAGQTHAAPGAHLTVEIPAGLAHVILASETGPLLMVAVASLPYDPSDSVPFPVHFRQERG